MSTEKPFVDFYSKHGLTPTRQDISDLGKHFQRRDALHRQLGIPPGLLRNAELIEFGPGSGHNAVFWASCAPARYVLVDATPASLEGTRDRLAEYYPGSRYEIVASDILAFASSDKFDFVVCEGVIPTQKDPPSFLRHVASFARPGGVVVMTCMDPIAVLPEILRRLAAGRVVSAEAAFEDRVGQLVDFFRPDLEGLRGMSRRYEDWVIDQILHPWTGPLLSVPEAIEAMCGEFEILGSSPRFLQDWRWYKGIQGKSFGFNDRGLEDYFRNAHEFVDYRFVNGPRDPERNIALAEVCQRIYERQFAAERGVKAYGSRDLVEDLARVERCLEGCHEETLAALREFSDCATRGQFSELDKFRRLWGRGQQYLGFIRNMPVT